MPAEIHYVEALPAAEARRPITIVGQVKDLRAVDHAAVKDLLEPQVTADVRKDLKKKVSIECK